jgi:hypothetical protein
MKKKTFCIVILTLSLGFSACTSKGGVIQTDAVDVVKDETNQKTNAHMVNIPVSYLNLPNLLTEETEEAVQDDSSGHLLPGSDLKEFIDDHGFSGAKWNDDGSLSLTMSSARYSEWKIQMKSLVDDTFMRLKDPTGGTPYILSIDATIDCRTVSVRVDKTSYESADFDYTPYMAGLAASTYQSFIGEEVSVTVEMVDDKTGEVLSSSNYPLAFSE